MIKVSFVMLESEPFFFDFAERVSRCQRDLMSARD